jgi:hypothetical protein
MPNDPPFQNNAAGTNYVPPQQFPQVNSSYVTGPPLALLTPWSLQLIARARELSDGGQNAFAIVLAHAACEWATEDALNRLLRHKALDDALIESLLAPYITTSLADNRICSLFEQLTGSDSQKESWWEPWKASRKVRHSVAHQGAAVTSQQATDAISLADDYVRHVIAAVKKVVGT